MQIHPVAALFPMLPDDELQVLAADIKENGLLYPIIIDGDVVIDGRNRLAACERAGVEPTFEQLGDNDPIIFILSANINRRHLTAGQRAMAIAQMFTGKHLEHGSKGALYQMAGISRAAVSQASAVIEHAPDLIEQVRAGGTLKGAYEIAVGRKNQQAERAEREEQQGKQLERLEQERERLQASIEALRTEVGPAVTLPPEPEMAITFSTTRTGEVKIVDPAPRLGENLDREQAFLRRLQSLKAGVAAITAEEVIEDAWFLEGHVLAVRSWGSQVVKMIYDMVERYNAVLEADGTVRSVK